MNSLGLSWQHVLNAYKMKSIWTISEYVENVVIPSGYEYFSWNGKVYKFFSDSKKYYDTGIFSASLEE